MKYYTSCLVMVGAVALFNLPDPALSATPLGRASLRGDAIQSFLPVYARYVSAIQEHGLAGFKRETDPRFMVRHGHDHWGGAAAFAQADAWLHGIQGGKVAVTIRRLTITGGTAVALTQESLTWRLAPEATGTGAVNLRQVWRRSGGRWKLAVQEWVPDKAAVPSLSIAYTVLADGGSAPTIKASQNITRP